MTTTPDFRELCAKLVKRLDELNCNFDIPSQSALIECALDALATPPGPPTDEELIRAAEESGFVYKDDGCLFNSYQDCTDIKTEVLSFARAALERWGRA
jgi:hypothetical protein